MVMMMENNTSKEGHLDVDLEKGRVNGEVNASGGGLFFGTIKMKQLDSEGKENVPESYNGSVVSNCGGGTTENVRLVIVDKKVGVVKSGGGTEKKAGREKPKAMSAKKPPKPPRPPRGLSLDSSDQKLIRELHELAKLKRARIERMKALKKSKEAKTSSSWKNQFVATLLTVLFCVVLLFQGISSRTNSAVNFQGSPTTSGATEGSIIAVVQHPISSVSTVNGPSSESPSLVQRVSSFNTPEKVSRAAG